MYLLGREGRKIEQEHTHYRHAHRLQTEKPNNVRCVCARWGIREHLQSLRFLQCETLAQTHQGRARGMLSVAVTSLMHKQRRVLGPRAGATTDSEREDVSLGPGR